MNSTPNIMKLGMGLAFIAAIAMLAGMAMDWKGTPESATLVGFDMLIATVFFAVGGCFSTHSPVKANTIVVLSALNVVFAVMAWYVGATLPVTTVVICIVAIVLAVIGNMGCTRNYIEHNRIA